MSTRDESFGVALVLTLIIIALIITMFVENDKIFPNQINDAIEMCKDNGGIRYIEADASTISYSLECNNGAEFNRNVIRVDPK